MDKYRNRLLDPKLKRQYDTLVNHLEGKLDETEMKNYKNLLTAKLNGAYRYGLFLGKSI